MQIKFTRKSQQKFFMSHSQWKFHKWQQFSNEEFYDEIFANLGFEAIFLEEKSMGEMAYLVSNADEIAMHFGFFARARVRLIALNGIINQKLLTASDNGQIIKQY